MNHANDGQNQHGAYMGAATLIMEDERMAFLLVKHLQESPGCRPPDMHDPKAEVPFGVTFDKKNKNIGTLVCGKCQKELGQCKMKVS